MGQGGRTGRALSAALGIALCLAVAVAWPASAIPGGGENQSQVVRDWWSAVCPCVALGLHDVDAGADPVAVNHVAPFEAVELGTAETGVESDRVRESILGFEREMRVIRRWNAPVAEVQ